MDAFTPWSEWSACDGPPSCLESSTRKCLLPVPSANIECMRGHTKQERACLAGAHLGCPNPNANPRPPPHSNNNNNHNNNQPLQPQQQPSAAVDEILGSNSGAGAQITLIADHI